MVNIDLVEPRIAQENPWAHLWGSLCTELTKTDNHPKCQCSMDWHPGLMRRAERQYSCLLPDYGYNRTGYLKPFPLWLSCCDELSLLWVKNKPFTLNLSLKVFWHSPETSSTVLPPSLSFVQSITWVSAVSFSARVLVGHAWGHWVQSPVMKTKQKPTTSIATALDALKFSYSL